MSHDLAHLVKERWVEYKRLLDAGETYAALVRIAEIENCLDHGVLRGTLRDQWEESVRAVQVTPEEIKRALHSATANIERLRRIIGRGTRFEYEELLLVITLRVELDLFGNFLRRHGITDVALLAIVLLDRELSSIAASPDLASVFMRAQNGARRNWGIPIKTKWLRPETDVS